MSKRSVALWKESWIEFLMVQQQVSCDSLTLKNPNAFCDHWDKFIYTLWSHSSILQDSTQQLWNILGSGFFQLCLFWENGRFFGVISLSSFSVSASRNHLLIRFPPSPRFRCEEADSEFLTTSGCRWPAAELQLCPWCMRACACKYIKGLSAPIVIGMYSFASYTFRVELISKVFTQHAWCKFLWQTWSQHSWGAPVLICDTSALHTVVDKSHRRFDSNDICPTWRKVSGHYRDPTLLGLCTKLVCAYAPILIWGITICSTSYGENVRTTVHACALQVYIHVFHSLKVHAIRAYMPSSKWYHNGSKRNDGGHGAAWQLPRQLYAL